MSASNLFFFYGSLRNGYWNNRIISSNSRCLGIATTRNDFRLYIGQRGTVPTCIPDDPAPGAHEELEAELGRAVPLHGEVWELSAQDARSVYLLETGYQHGSFEVSLDAHPDDILLATIFHHTDPGQCYYLNGGPLLIASGDYTTMIGSEGERIVPVVPPSTTSLNAPQA